MISTNDPAQPLLFRTEVRSHTRHTRRPRPPAPRARRAPRCAQASIGTGIVIRSKSRYGGFTIVHAHAKPSVFRLTDAGLNGTSRPSRGSPHPALNHDQSLISMREEITRLNHAQSPCVPLARLRTATWLRSARSRLLRGKSQLSRLDRFGSDLLSGRNFGWGASDESLDDIGNGRAADGALGAPLLEGESASVACTHMAAFVEDGGYLSLGANDARPQRKDPPRGRRWTDRRTDGPIDEPQP